MKEKTVLNHSFFQKYNLLFIKICLLISFILSPQTLWALEKNTGESLFKNNCIGCHINGGNIIRRSKSLKIKALKRNGIASSEKIAEIAREGIGIMDGYDNVLKENEDQILGVWVWEQAQKAWVQE